MHTQENMPKKVVFSQDVRVSAILLLLCLQWQSASYVYIIMRQRAQQNVNTHAQELYYVITAEQWKFTNSRLYVYIYVYLFLLRYKHLSNFFQVSIYRTNFRNSLRKGHTHRICSFHQKNTTLFGVYPNLEWLYYYVSLEFTVYI